MAGRGAELSQLWFANELDAAKTGQEPTWRETRKRKTALSIGRPLLCWWIGYFQIMFSSLANEWRHKTNPPPTQSMFICVGRRSKALDIDSGQGGKQSGWVLSAHCQRGKGNAGRETWQSQPRPWQQLCVTVWQRTGALLNYDYKFSPAARLLDDGAN